MSKERGDDWVAMRELWQHRGQRRPDFAVVPGPDQESVWDYPRPPRLMPDRRPVEVRVGEILIAQSSHATRVLETASPPTFYIPHVDVRMELLRPASGHSFCEWKGRAGYFDVRNGEAWIEQAAWTYEQPFDAFAELTGHIGFYPGRVACWVDGERVRPQPGGFYGGWVTNEIVGPFKGDTGTGAW